MSESIETTFVGSKRIETGSEFSLNLVPFEFGLPACVYKYPRLNLRIGFQARWVSEMRPSRHESRMVEGVVRLGIILVKDELCQLINKDLERAEARPDVQTLVRDCYELMIAYMRAANQRQSFLDEPHIYEAEERDFGTLTSSIEVGPEALQMVKASKSF